MDLTMTCFDFVDLICENIENRSWKVHTCKNYLFGFKCITISCKIIKFIE
jgi:hypothetical protein